MSPRLPVPIPASDVPLVGEVRVPAIDTITMQASTGQRIVIHTDTGEVDLGGLEPSAAARLFWDAVRLWTRRPE
jgi:hypothetical protein